MFVLFVCIFFLLSLFFHRNCIVRNQKREREKKRDTASWPMQHYSAFGIKTKFNMFDRNHLNDNFEKGEREREKKTHTENTFNCIFCWLPHGFWRGKNNLIWKSFINAITVIILYIFLFNFSLNVSVIFSFNFLLLSIWNEVKKTETISQTTESFCVLCLSKTVHRFNCNSFNGYRNENVVFFCS